MNQSLVHENAISLVGVSVRTTNAREKSGEGRIQSTLTKFFNERLFEKIPKRVDPGLTYCVYTQYEFDENGEYTYFVGERAEPIASDDGSLETLIIPAQKYIKFDIGPGIMPNVCIQAWEKIWKMSPEELGGIRKYAADFEVYGPDMNPLEATFPIYIGVE